MAMYRYKARDASGQLRLGEMDAANGQMVAAFLRSNTLIPLEVKEAPAPSPISQWVEKTASRRVAKREVVMFSRQMYSLLKAGVPLLPALASLKETYGSQTALGRVLGEIQSDLDAGRQLSQAMRRHPKAFDDLFVSLVEVGETTGNLDIVFRQLSEYIDRDEQTKAKVNKAIRYPSLVVVAMALSLTILNLLVIPQFVKLFANAKVELPLVTKVLIWTSEFSQNYWWGILLGLVGAGFLVRQFLRTKAGRYHWDHYKLGIPLVGSIMIQGALARFARTLELTGRAGVPLLRGMGLIVGTVNNAFMAKRLQEMRAGVERGESLARTGRASGMFPPLVLQMLAVGEEAGTIDELMGEVADFYEREVNYAIDKLSTYIEPILIVVMGAMVLVLALGVFLPMWDMIKVMR